MALQFGGLDLNSNTDEKKVDLNKQASEHIKCLIIGSGPAGYTAAIYAARANLSPVIIQGMQPGGQLTTTTEVDNFPGYPQGVTGPVLMEDLKAQAERFGTDTRWGEVTEVDFSVSPKRVVVDGTQVLTADTVIISTGATAKYLGIDDEKKYAGSGVSACATCDGFFYRGLKVAVVGGGDTACEEASYLAGIVEKVFLIVRKDYLKASKAMQQRVFDNPKIEVLFKHSTKGLFGDGAVEGATLIKNQGEANEEEVKIDIQGFFLAIGHTPNSKIFADYLETDENGYIKTIPGTTKTNVAGVFAAGDIKDPVYKQAITAAGSGCMAALDAEKYLAEHK